ncbi:MAG: hypothetical protein AAB384_01515 [Patescibacteria group bacterium]
MTDAVRMVKQSATYVVATATILWAVGFAAMVAPLTASAATLTNGMLIKRADLSTVYYYMNNGRYTFPSQKTFEAWYPNFNGVTVVSADELAAVPLAGNIVVRPGTFLVKITTDPKVYAVEPKGVLRWVKTEEVAKSLWGANWGKSVIDVSDAFFTNYTTGAELATAGVYPTGAVVMDGASKYYVEGNMKRMVSDAAFTSNHFNTKFVVTGSLAGLTAGSALGASDVADTAQTGGTPVSPTAPTTLTISLDSATPAAGSVVVDTTASATLGQRMAPMTAVRFSAVGAEAVVTMVTATRTGISKDSDVDEVMLMDGETILAESSSISSGKVTWSNSNGIFTVPAGQTKTIWVKANINKSASTGTTVGFTVNAAEVKSGAASGSAVGNNMTIATVTDLGYLQVATSSPVSATTMDANASADKELAKFKILATDQNLLVKRITFTQIGSVSASDIKNIKLTVAGTQFGATYADLGNNKLTFDFTNSADGGLKITAGQSKFLDLYGTVVGGTNRNFQFSVQEENDVTAWDLQYGVYAPVVTLNTTAFSIQTTAQTTINTGTLTITPATESTKNNIATGATGVNLATFDLVAAGEAVKVDSMSLYLAGSSNNAYKNVKLFLNGVQVGTAVASSTSGNNTSLDADYTFSNNFVVTPGTTGKLVVTADTTDTSVVAGDTVQVVVRAGSANAQAKTSLTSISTAAATAYSLTFASSVPTLSENLTVADGSSVNPTAVSSTKSARISSFVVKAGSGEGAKITNITVKADVTGGLSAVFSNLRLQHNGADIAGVKGTLTTGASDTYDYTLTTPIVLAKGETYVVDVLADVTGGSSANINADTNGILYPSSVSYQTLETSQSGTATLSAGLQNVYVASSGSLTVALASDSTAEHYVTMGSTDVELGRFKFSAGKEEGVTISELTPSIMTLFATSTTGVVGNLRLMDGDTMVGSAVSSLATASATSTAVYATSTAYATFTGLNLVVPKNSSKTLRLVADITGSPDSFSSSTFFAGLLYGYDSSNSASIVARGAESGASITTFTGLTGDSMRIVATAKHPLKANLSIAHASDAPSGATSKGDDKTVAKWVFTNPANVNNQSATIKLLNLKVDTSISAAAAHAAREIKIYKDSISSGNLLASTSYVSTLSSGDLGSSMDDTNIAEASFTDLEVPSGSSKTVIVTMDTDDAASNNTLTIGLAVGGTSGGSTAVSGITWTDGYTAAIYDLKPTASGLGGLPFSGKTLTY